jgi:hypothetical protein
MRLIDIPDTRILREVIPIALLKSEELPTGRNSLLTYL